MEYPRKIKEKDIKYVQMRYPPELKEQVVKYVNQGGTRREAVKIFAVPYSAVCYWTHNPDKKRRHPKDLCEKVMDFLGNGGSVLDASRDFKVPFATIYDWYLKKQNVQSVPLLIESFSPQEPLKFDSDKIRFELLPPLALEEVASVFTYGSLKYDDLNWMKGLKFSRLLGACMRHLWSWYRGKDKDPESGLSHLAHAACNIFMLLHYQKSINNALDDRPFKEFIK